MKNAFVSHPLAIASVAMALVTLPAKADDKSKDLRKHHQPSHLSTSNSHSQYAPVPAKASDRQRKQHASEVGFRVGEDDFHNHHTKSFSRHSSLYDAATRDAFVSGYSDGYDRARSEATRKDRPYVPPAPSSVTVPSNLYPSGYYPYTPPPRQSPDVIRQRHAYDVGFKVGQDDFYRGISRFGNRHSGLFDASTSNSFAQGYSDGYDTAIESGRPPEDPHFAPETLSGVQIDYRDNHGSNTFTFFQNGQYRLVSISQNRTVADNREGMYSFQITGDSRILIHFSNAPALSLIFSDSYTATGGFAGDGRTYAFKATRVTR